MTVISEEYRAQNQQLHREGSFGRKGHTYAGHIQAICEALGSQDVLDYGCGQHTLQQCLPFKIREYDPCMDGFDESPDPADVVVCTDVLEHIEPVYLDAVLDDLKRVTKRVGFFAVDDRPAQKFLSDGRNAHLIQEGPAWWFPKFYQRWSSVQISDMLYDSKTTPGLVKKVGFCVVVRI